MQTISSFDDANQFEIIQSISSIDKYFYVFRSYNVVWQ